MIFFRASAAFSLGLERTGGFETVAFCEIEDYPRRVLAKHWPKVPIYHDVRELTADTLRRDGIAVDVICGGFPCQDISFAGKGAGIAGERSGLWREYARLVRELRPRFVIVENVAALLGRGLADVLGDLAAIGYDAEWHCIPASAVGAPHRRDRLWIVAHPGGEQHESDSTAFRRALAAQLHAANADSQGEHVGTVDAEVVCAPEPVADANSRDGHGRRRNVQVGRERIARKTPWNGHTARIEWFTEPAVCRVAHGVPFRVDRLCGLGNAVVPEIPRIIGKAIMQAEGMTA